MADEKDKGLNEAVLNYLRALGLKVPSPVLHAGTDLLLGKSVFGDLEKLSVGQLNEAIRKLNEQADKQKKALATGQVDLQAANEWIISRWPAPRPCPLCNHEEWNFGGSFVQLPTSALGLQGAPRTSPCVAVVCGHCGNTILLNAIVMGLLPKGEE
jgi:hypothetical protein